MTEARKCASRMVNYSTSMLDGLKRTVDGTLRNGQLSVAYCEPSFNKSLMNKAREKRERTIDKFHNSLSCVVNAPS